MPKFRKKPVVIEAEPVTTLLRDAERDWNRLPDWMRVAHDDGEALFLIDAIEIVTKEGVMRGDKGDWIIQGAHGELYPIKPDIFADTYERVEDE